MSKSMESAKRLKEYCSAKTSCKNCKFNGRPDEKNSFHCILRNQPRFWALPEDEYKQTK